MQAGTTSSSPEDEGTDTLARLTSKGKSRVPGFVEEVEQAVIGNEPVQQLFLGPVAACDDEELAGADEWGDLFTIELAYPAAAGVGVGREGNGIKGAFVKDSVEAITQPIPGLLVQKVPLFEA